MKEKSKSHKAVANYLTHYGKTLPDGKWSFSTELEQGKGMASSTADIVATIRCLDALFDQISSPALISEILHGIERSDSVFLDSHALYLSGKQKLVHQFPGNTQFYACYINEGETIDTEELVDLLLTHYEQEFSSYLVNLDNTINAFMNADLKAICRCATESARLSQDVVPKRHFDTLLAHQAHFKADGIVIAHTGSLLGYLFIEKPDYAMIGELSAFFFSLGYQCRFVRVGTIVTR
jgi:uncharacterized protein involved in propanediol utilization